MALASLTPITYRDRLESRNDALKEIVVIRPEQITAIVSEFQRFLNNNEMEQNQYIITKCHLSSDKLGGFDTNTIDIQQQIV